MLCVSSGAFLRANQTTDVPPRTRGSIPIEIKPLAAHVHGENYVVDNLGGLWYDVSNDGEWLGWASGPVMTRRVLLVL